jgi:heterodisulfide reductase subunit C
MGAMSTGHHPPLRTVVLAATGQDARRCWHCSTCAEIVDETQDLSLEGILQMVVMDEEDVLTCRTLWSERALADARHQCAGQLDMVAVLLALRAEALRRGLTDRGMDA